MRGLLVELSRFRSRRAVAALLLAMVAISFVVMAAVVYETRPLPAAEQTRAEQRFERERTDALPQIETCRDDPNRTCRASVERQFALVPGSLTRVRLEIADVYAPAP